MSHTERRSLLACLLTVAVAIAALAWVTHGFSALTSEGVRRAALIRSPRQVPPLTLIDSRGKTLDLASVSQDRKATLLAFVYTRCTTVCSATASSEAYLQSRIRADALHEQVQLLTISFDPGHDTPEVLRQYGDRMHADASLWRFAAPVDGATLRKTLEVFGIVVIPDGMGGYSHNAAIFLIDPDGYLAGAFEIDSPDQALAAALTAWDRAHAR